MTTGLTAIWGVDEAIAGVCTYIIIILLREFYEFIYCIHVRHWLFVYMYVLLPFAVRNDDSLYALESKYSLYEIITAYSRKCCCIIH